MSDNITPYDAEVYWNDLMDKQKEERNKYKNIKERPTVSNNRTGKDKISVNEIVNFDYTKNVPQNGAKIENDIKNNKEIISVLQSTDYIPDDLIDIPEYKEKNILDLYARNNPFENPLAYISSKQKTLL